MPTMKTNLLLAKSVKDPADVQPRETLVGHTQDVVDAFTHLYGSSENPARLAQKWFHFFMLNPSHWQVPFFLYGRLSCYLHDIGKANSGFQEAVQCGGDRQVIRHEHLSTLLIWHPSIRNWIMKTFPDIDPLLLGWIVLGHHLKAEKEKFALSLEPDRKCFQIYPEGIEEILNNLSRYMGVSKPNIAAIEKIWAVDRSPLDTLRAEFINASCRYFRTIRNDVEKIKILNAARSALIAADSAGSGLTREGKDLSGWIEIAFDTRKILDGQQVEEKVILPRIAEIERKGKVFVWRSFQEEIEKSSERALLISSCGSGKTLAAWRWIKAQTHRSPVSRIIFLYPTRGTATEGFRDYVSWAPEADAALVQGTASFDLMNLFTNPQDSRKDKDFTVEDRLFGLAYWNRRIFSATVDQFLGFMQLSYRSLCLIPLLADSVVVVDEVHSFDPSLFSALKLFLKTFNVPVLCMTASLPVNRRRELMECGLALYPDPATHFFEDLETLEGMPRYRVHILEGPEDAERIVKEKADKKTLWVVNTVTRCQELAARFPHALCYHSRFKLSDRKDRHREVIDGFNESPILALTTQVCEMSLDLDADVLISEFAPISSLIQRMGRCNRHASPGQGEPGDVYLYPVDNPLPYVPDDLKGLDEFVHALKDQTVSQVQLTELLEILGTNQKEVERYSAFLDSGPWADSRETHLREDTDYLVQAILDEEIPHYLNAPSHRRDGYILPVPKRKAQFDTRLPRWLHSAPIAHYDKRLGFLDKPLEIQS